jgi:hypothetical protein
MIAARLPRPAFRDIAAAALIVLAASAVVSADEHLQDWIPDVLVMPEDAEIVTERSIGSTVRMFSIATTADTEGLLTDWEERLNSNGFPVTRTADDLLDGSMEFSGPGIANAKIVVAPTTEDGRNVIEFDATLN